VVYSKALLRRQVLPMRDSTMYRLIDNEYKDTPLAFVASTGRFNDPSPPSNPDNRFKTLYAAENVATATWEAIVRDTMVQTDRVYIPLSVLAATTLVEVRWMRPLQLLDLTGNQYLKINAGTEPTKDTSHDAGQRLSSQLYADVSGCDGIVYSSRYTGLRCVVLYDRAASRLETPPRMAPLMSHPLIARNLTPRGLHRDVLLDT